MNFNLKIALLFVCSALLSTESNAQVSTYSFTSSAGTYNPIAGTVLFGGSWDDGASTLLTIPFPFLYDNVFYTTASVGANGYLSIGAVAPGYSACGLAGGLVNSIAAYGTELIGSGTSTIEYTTRGVTPNRQFVVQWTDCDHWNNGSQNHWTFQIILNETSNNVQVVWGPSTDATIMGPNQCIDVVDESGDVGLIGATAVDFNVRNVTNGVNTWATSVAGTSLTDVCNMSPTNIPANGLTYTWIPVPPTPMVFVSSTTTFVNSQQGVGRNSTTQLLKVEVETSGILSPFSVSSLLLSTAGSTDAAADILNAKVYYTGLSNVFSNAIQFGTTVNNPNGAYTVNGNATLSSGTNYFWIAYTITANATLNDSLRGCCNQITGTGAMGIQTPSITCPNDYQTITALGFWTPIATLAPDQNAGVMLLLSDGTVMAKTDNGGADGIGTIWDKLTPDIHGSYVNGTWSQLAPMFDSRLYFSSQVLQDGRVYVAGGEYGSGGSLGEVYDPILNTWTMTPAQGQRISDANSEILPDGKLLQALVNQAGPVICDIYDPGNNTYVSGPSCLGSHNESTWVKLPDQSILMVNMPDTTSERYIPSLNQWIPDGNVPVRLYDAFGSETGAGLLLPDGRAFFIGATGHTAYYTPTGNNSPGTWAAGPDIPGNNGQVDAPAALMVDGKILLSAAPAPTSSATLFIPPTVFYEFNYLTNSYTQISAPDGTPSVPIACYQTNMLLLPDGNVLYSNQQDTSIGRQYYIYTPAGAPLAAAKPTINTVDQTGCATFSITGTLFNGINEGTCYGDDWQMATNYPLIRLRSGGNVYYARSYNWNRTDVMTGSLADTADFTLPVSLPGGDYWLEVVVNGVASDSFLFHPPSQTVTFIGLPDSICSVSSPVTLSGNPSGGTFTGSGIVGNIFNPSLAALGNNTITYTFVDSLGCSWPISHIVNVSICTGIEEISRANQFISAYPNPAGNSTTILYYSGDRENFSITLIDLVGRTILENEGISMKGNNTQLISLDKLSKGIYTLRLSIGERVLKTKLIVE
ncbi:MAG: T9SS type A sorting domain-containing protein [Bacteroidetes bacterium]|nr:T9SS type A sorting domain-containing protein [Bacteroidota bacterium]